MATTLDNLLTLIRSFNAVPAANVNFGITDGLEPPYVNVTSYEHEPVYDTSKTPQGKEAKFTIVVIDKSSSSAEAIATVIDTGLQAMVTPPTNAIWQDKYSVGQTEKLYLFGVQIDYSLEETS